MTARYLRTSDVTAQTGIPGSTLRQWRSMKVGPKSIKLRGVVVYPEADLDAWIAAQGETTARGGVA